MNKKILFLGVGGIGVSALAIAAKKLGAIVFGYDSTPSKLTLKLESLKIPVFSDSSMLEVSYFDLVVYSSAILNSHPLLFKARGLNIQCLQRAMFLALLMKDFNYSVAVTGTHGKTTTASILATLFCRLDITSSFVVGGVVKYTGSNIEINGTDKLVLEADESDASFLYLNPQSIVVTNIDLDHMATYENSYENLLAQFAEFLNKQSVNNIYMCIDDGGCKDLLARHSLKCAEVILYGFSNQADVQIIDYFMTAEGRTSFKILYKNRELYFTIQLPGQYNVRNAAVCIIKCLDLGFKYQDIKRVLSNIAGVVRRFDIYLKKIAGYRVDVIDDYGHHPVEVTNCLGAVKDKYPGKKIIHVFQPHRYTRNRDLINEWNKALRLSDHLIILPTYSAGEEVIRGAESRDITKNIVNCIVANSFEKAVHYIGKLVDNSCVILIQGAGDVANLVEMLGE